VSNQPLQKTIHDLLLLYGKKSRAEKLASDLNVIPVAMFCDSSACNRGTVQPTAGSTLLKVPWLEILPPDTNVLDYVPLVVPVTWRALSQYLDTSVFISLQDPLLRSLCHIVI
jgi:hypothetical protein